MSGKSPYQILRNRFPENEYVLIQEVSDRSGFSRSRSLDFMLINLWESRGLAITGIELKRSRTDWLRELKKPEKQENHIKYCDYFYLLTDNIAAFPEEIPVNWGHMHITDKGVLKTVKQAPKLNPLPVDRSLLCAMLRRAASKSGYVFESEIEDHIQQRAEILTREKNTKRQVELENYENLKKSLKEFEDAIGIGLDEWKSRYRWRMEPKEVGAAIKILMDNKPEDILKHMETLKSNADRIYNTVNKSLEEIKKIVNETTGNREAGIAGNEREEVSA